MLGVLRTSRVRRGELMLADVKDMLRRVRLLRVQQATALRLSVVNSMQLCKSRDVRAVAAAITCAIHLGAAGDASRQELVEQDMSRHCRRGRARSMHSSGTASSAVQPLKLMQVRLQNT
jgi:hypothetical protein